MAYYVNGKAFTDHPLMDEICFNCKRILKGIVIKNDVLANNSETNTSYQDYEMYTIYDRDGKISFEYYPFNSDLLYAFGYNKFQVRAYLEDKYRIPESDRESLTEFANQYFKDNYFEENGKFKETNDYYRMLMGLPPHNTGEEYYIYLSESDIPSLYTKEVDLSKPLHLQDSTLINILYADGIIDSFRSRYKGSNYSYILYLGERSIDLVKARSAAKWDILYMPNVNNLVKDRFTELYKINRDIYVNKGYQEFFAQTGEYYDQCMILIVLAQTFNDMIVDTPEWYIKRDIFDIRSCKYFLDSNGVDFFKVIPLKYQIRIVKNLNRLITYKSSNKNCFDIIDIFAVKGVKVLKYWLYKKKVTKIDSPEDDGGFDFGEIGVSEPTAIGDYDFGDLMEGKDPHSIVEDGDDYDFNIISVYQIDTTPAPEVEDDKYKYDFDDINNPESTLTGEYDFASEDNGRVKDSVVVDGDDYDFGEDNSQYLDESKKDGEDSSDRDEIVDPKDRNKGKYELEFIVSEINKSYVDYIDDSRYRRTYDDITFQDKYWDGDLSHSYVKSQIAKQDFTVVGTKYMSVEYEVDLARYLYQMEYMLGMILHSSIDTSDIRISVPSLNEFAKFALSDLFLLLIAFTNNFSVLDNKGTDVRTLDIWKGAPPEIDEKLYDWKKKTFPEMFIKKDGRVHCFNPKLDKDELIEIIERRHSHTRWGDNEENSNTPPYIDDQYKEKADKWLESLGVFDYIVPNYVISSIDDLIGIYENNTKCYDLLHDAMENPQDQDDMKYMEYIYQELYTTDFDKDFYTNPKNGEYYDNLVEILRDHDYLLYETYNKIMSETNIESRQDMIRSVMNDIITTLEYYFNRDDLDFLFGFTANESFQSIVYYIYLMLNFFKSYKVYFLDPYVVFNTSGDKVENSAKVVDRVKEWRYKYNKWDKAFVSDAISGINLQLYEEEKDPINVFSEDQVGIFAHYEPDLFMDYNFDGYSPDDKVDRKDVNGGSPRIENGPYIMVNGGKPYHKYIDLSDIDGGAPDVYNREYFDIDGGYPLHKDDTKTDMFGSQMFNYEIDGGCPDGRRFINNCADTKLVGTELSTDVIISPRTNYIEIREDGLFVDPTNFANVTEFNNLVSTLSNLIAWILTQGNDLEADLVVMTDMEKLKSRIQTIINSITYNMEYVNDQITVNGKFKINLKAFIDKLNLSITEEFRSRVNPFEWEELDK